MLFRSDSTEGQESRKNVLQVPVEDIKDQWKCLWRSLIDDKVRAEGIANQDYSLLFVERGTVIIATKDFKPLDFKEVLRLNGVYNGECFSSPLPSVGGYRKFARTVLNKQSRARRWTDAGSTKGRKENNNQQKKKSGRGWLHYHMKK